jgi:hypothetical protein
MSATSATSTPSSRSRVEANQSDDNSVEPHGCDRRLPLSAHLAARVAGLRGAARRRMRRPIRRFAVRINAADASRGVMTARLRRSARRHDPATPENVGRENPVAG